MGSTQVGDHWGSPRADYFFSLVNNYFWNHTAFLSQTIWECLNHFDCPYVRSWSRTSMKMEYFEVYDIEIFKNTFKFFLFYIWKFVFYTKILKTNLKNCTVFLQMSINQWLLWIDGVAFVTNSHNIILNTLQHWYMTFNYIQIWFCSNSTISIPQQDAKNL